LAEEKRNAEARLQEALDAVSTTRIPRRVSDALVDQIPERIGPPPNRVPDSWKAYDDVLAPTVNVFLRDARRILRTWTRDPLVLCCLIRNLAAIGNLDRHLSRGNNRVLGTLYQIRAMLDLMIGIFQKDIGVRIDESLDFLRFFMLSVVGAIVSTLDILRLSIQDRIFKLLQFDESSVVARCIPFASLIKIVLVALQDPVNGLLARLSNFLTDWSNHIRQEVHLKFNCGELTKNRSARRELLDRESLLDDEIRRVVDGQIEGEAGEKVYHPEIENVLDRVPSWMREQVGDRLQAQLVAANPEAAPGGELISERENVRQQLRAIESKIFVANDGASLLRDSACYLRKVEFIQQLKFYRNIVNLVIRGLERGILCATATADEITNVPNPLDTLGLGGNTPFRNPPHTPFPDEGWNPYPTDEELILFLDDGFRDDPVARRLIEDLRDGSDEDAGKSAGDDFDRTNDELLRDIRTIETIADCTSVMGEDTIMDLAATLQSLESNNR
jgi:hypothetical protein